MHRARTHVASSWLLALVLPLFPGCGHDEHGHGEGGGHAHVAPRGGVLVELGDHQGNLELLLEPASGQLSVWSLDAHAESPVRLAADKLELAVTAITKDGAQSDANVALVLAPVASAITGETVGDTSEFRGQDPALVGASGFAGRLASIDHRGTVYRDVAVSYTHPAGE